MPAHALYPCHDTVEDAARFGDGEDEQPSRRGGEEYTDAMANLAAAASAIATLGNDSRPVGATVTTAMSISTEPIIAVTLGWQSRTLAAIRASRIFTVNILRLPAEDVARMLGTRSPDKFDGVPWQYTRSGTPWLPTLSLNAVECRLVSEIPVGDHALLLGAVSEVHFPPRCGVERPCAPCSAHSEKDRPLVYWRQSYHQLV